MGQGGFEKTKEKERHDRRRRQRQRQGQRQTLSLSGRGRSDYKRTKGRNVGGRRTRATVNSMDPLCFPGKQQQLHTEAAAGNRSNSWPLWADPGRSGPIWAVLGRSGQFWADRRCSGPICAIRADLGRSGPSWASRAYARTFKVTQRPLTAKPPRRRQAACRTCPPV